MLKLSVIVPAYNEEATIIPILELVNAQKLKTVDLEVLVVDDGSNDRSVELLEAHPALYSTLIKMPKNRGKGAAIKAGLEQASGDYILFQDSDLEYDPTEYQLLVEPVLAYSADIVMGSRFVAPKITRVAYFWNKVGNRIITLLFNVLNNTTFTDVYSCYLLYRRTLVDPKQLKTLGWEQHAEILSLAVKGTDSIYEVPISYYGRTKEEGKKIRAHHIISIVWTMVARRFFG